MNAPARALVAAALLGGCSRHGAAPAAPGEARRIVSLAPATTEALFAIGDGDRVVGRSRYCDYPPEALRVPIVGGFVDVDEEAVLALAPDLVVGTQGPIASRLKTKLAARDIPMFFPDAHSIATIEAMIAELGRRTDHAAGATRVDHALDEHIHAVERAVAAQPLPRVVVVVDLNPVVVAGPGSFVDELLSLAHAVNAVHDGAAWQVIGFERVAELDPDLVVDATHEVGPSPIAADRPGWSGVTAVQAGRVVSLKDERALRPGPRLADGLASLARAIHPGVSVAAW